MTLSTTSSKIQYEISGASPGTTFAFDFLIFDEEHLVVVRLDDDGFEHTLSLSTDYTVTGVGDAGGGNVELASEPDGQTLTIYRSVPAKQELDLVNGDPFDAELLEQSFDKLTMLAQQMEEQVGRSLLQPVTTADEDLVDAETYISEFNAIKADAETARNEAYDWAEEDEDVEVSDAGGNAGYSAYHWTKKAEDEKIAADAAKTAAQDAQSAAETARDKAQTAAETAAAINAAVAPAHYERDVPWSAKGNGTAAERYALVSPSYLTVNIDRSGYLLGSAVELDLSAAASWDDLTATDWTVAANRAGKDFYIFACQPTSGDAPDIILSANSTIPDSMPSGATPDADNTRKIGGFHCLCADVGTISGHALSGYVQGDILPLSVWDLRHRPRSEPEGMVYDEGSGVWVDIYLVSVQSGELGSVYGATIADGASAETFHWYKFDQWLRRIKKRFPFQGEFVSLSIGSNQGTNISGSSDPGTTGGHSDTSGRRMISDIGCEDCCGALWQWGIEGGATNDVGSTWEDAFDGHDSDVAGEHYEAPNRPRFGGCWGSGSGCGSRGSLWHDSPLVLRSSGGARGVAEPLAR